MRWHSGTQKRVERAKQRDQIDNEARLLWKNIVKTKHQSLTNLAFMRLVPGADRVVRHTCIRCISVVYFLRNPLVYRKISRTTTIYPGIFGGRALWADSGPPRMSTIAPRDQFKPIRIGENSVVNYKEWYKLDMQCFLWYTMEFTTCHLYFLGYTLALRCDSFVYINSFKL